jgi:transposase InsO family protein
MLKANKITCSMSGKGCCWDNAVSESFFSTFKLELELDENQRSPADSMGVAEGIWPSGLRATTTVNDDTHRLITSAPLSMKHGLKEPV